MERDPDKLVQRAAEMRRRGDGLRGRLTALRDDRTRREFIVMATDYDEMARQLEWLAAYFRAAGS